MNMERQKVFIIRFAYSVIILGLLYIAAKYMLPALMPFVIGFIAAALLRHIIDKIEEKTKLKRSLVAIVILLIFYGIVILVLSIVGGKVFSFLRDLFYQLPKLYVDTIEPALIEAMDNILLHFPEIESYIEEVLNSISNSIASALTTASTTVVGAITGFAGQIPSLLVSVIFTIVASFFFTIDYHPIVRFIVRQFPKEKRNSVIQVKNNVVGILGKFIKAYAALISVTFVELSIGFLILKVPNAFLIALIVSIIDILPILGTGAVLIPWAIIAFVFGRTSFGVGMLVLYIVITVVRQILEPKVVGQQIGLHPVVTLLCMYVGAQLLGIIGLFAFPIIATLLKKMNDDGTIHLFK